MLEDDGDVEEAEASEAAEDAPTAAVPAEAKRKPCTRTLGADSPKAWTSLRGHPDMTYALKVLLFHFLRDANPDPELQEAENPTLDPDPGITTPL